MSKAPSPPIDSKLYTTNTERCPKCGSDDISIDRNIRLYQDYIFCYKCEEASDV